VQVKFIVLPKLCNQLTLQLSFVKSKIECINIRIRLIRELTTLLSGVARESNGCRQYCAKALEAHEHTAVIKNEF